MSKKRDLINNINQIVDEMANVLANPNTTLIGKEYFRTHSQIKIEELIEEFLANEPLVEPKSTPTFPVRKKKKK